MNIIVVVDKQWAIGKDNNLLFHLPHDLKENFKKHTLNKVVVMGSNTFRSLPKGALPNRTNIVLDSKGTSYPNAITVSSLDNLFVELQNYNTEDVFVIGGGMVYKLLLPYCHKAYITHVDAVGNGTVFFPDIHKMANWSILEQQPVVVDNGYNTQFTIYINSATLSYKA